MSSASTISPRIEREGGLGRPNAFGAKVAGLPTAFDSCAFAMSPNEWTGEPTASLPTGAESSTADAAGGGGKTTAVPPSRGDGLFDHMEKRVRVHHFQAASSTNLRRRERRRSSHSSSSSSSSPSRRSSGSRAWPPARILTSPPRLALPPQEQAAAARSRKTAPRRLRANGSSGGGGAQTDTEARREARRRALASGWSLAVQHLCDSEAAVAPFVTSWRGTFSLHITSPLVIALTSFRRFFLQAVSCRASAASTTACGWPARSSPSSGTRPCSGRRTAHSAARHRAGATPTRSTFPTLPRARTRTSECDDDNASMKHGKAGASKCTLAVQARP